MEDELCFDWDPANIAHIGRHGIDPREVSEVLANDAIDVSYEVIHEEQRWTSVGHTDGMRILVVVWTMRGEAIRPVTAFDAGKQLALDYLAQKGW
jgi:uncharacterized DUF497 family protein